MTQYWLGLDCSWLKAGLQDREGREAGVAPVAAYCPARLGRADMAESGNVRCHSAPAYPFRRHVTNVGIGISAQERAYLLLIKNDKTAR